MKLNVPEYEQHSNIKTLNMKNFPRITGDNTDEPYYVRAKFFLNIQETDMYGFHMISDHSGKLYVSTDADPANAVSLLSAESLAESLAVP